MKKEYETVAEFFYKRASDRVRQRVTESNLKHIEILYPDHKQISRIINNNRQRNNTYLINDSALETTYEDDETQKKIPCGLIPNLSFNSNKEVLWGTDEEITNYIHELFFLLWNEVCLKSERIDSELYLCDYIPYAKYSTYWKIFFEVDTINDPRFSFMEFEGKMLNFPAITFGIKEDTVIKNIDSARDKALTFYIIDAKKLFFQNLSILPMKLLHSICSTKLLKMSLLKKNFFLC